MTQHRERARRSFAALAVTALVVITACSTEDEPSAKPSAESTSPDDASASPSTSPSETLHPDDAAVLKAYGNALDARADAYSKANSKGTDLHKHVTLDALGNMEGALRGMRKDGHVTTGKPTIDPEVEDVQKDQNPPTAKVTDCMDVEPWKLVDKKTKKPVPLPPERLTKHEVTAELEHWGKNGWMLTKFEPKGRKC